MRRVLNLGAIVFLMIALAAVPAAAQQQEGDSELQLQGTLSISTGDAEDNGAVSVNWGRFFTDRQEIGVTAFTVFTEDVSGYAGPFYRYNLASGTTVPYVGASAAAGFGDFSSGDALVNLEGGVRWFLARNMAFTLGGVYTYDVDESEFLDAVQVLFGFSYLWDRN